jgi:hypothetical protein
MESLLREEVQGRVQDDASFIVFFHAHLSGVNVQSAYSSIKNAPLSRRILHGCVHFFPGSKQVSRLAGSHGHLLGLKR